MTCDESSSPTVMVVFSGQEAWQQLRSPAWQCKHHTGENGMEYFLCVGVRVGFFFFFFKLFKASMILSIMEPMDL